MACARYWAVHLAEEGGARRYDPHPPYLRREELWVVSWSHLAQMFLNYPGIEGRALSVLPYPLENRIGASITPR
jgi:hypothetical protein